MTIIDVMSNWGTILFWIVLAIGLPIWFIYKTVSIYTGEAKEEKRAQEIADYNKEVMKNIESTKRYKKYSEMKKTLDDFDHMRNLENMPFRNAREVEAYRKQFKELEKWYSDELKKKIYE